MLAAGGRKLDRRPECEIADQRGFDRRGRFGTEFSCEKRKSCSQISTAPLSLVLTENSRRKGPVRLGLDAVLLAELRPAACERTGRVQAAAAFGFAPRR